MPASRSARAMILAPRSCPSRPGLATTTRIFFVLVPASTGRASLKDRRLRVGAEHRLEPVHLLLLERRVDPQDLDRLLALVHVLVHAHHDPLARVDLLLVAERR